jgi:Rhodopirellula transposase DDE domain
VAGIPSGLGSTSHIGVIDESAIRRGFEALGPVLDERGYGGWRRPDASLLDDLRSLVEPTTRGDPQSPLLWTCKSLRKLAESLPGRGHKIGRTLVGELLHKLDYSLQAIARRARDRTMPIATRNSTLSMIRRKKRSLRTSRDLR